MSTGWTHRIALAGAALLLTAWSLVVPIFEAPDEGAHWLYARYLHDQWSLPHYAPGFEEANSPPLAYLLFAPVAWEGRLPSSVIATRADGTLQSLAPPRTFLNTDRDLRRYGAIRLGRLIAVGISLVTILVCFHIGRLAAGGNTGGWLTASFVALLPQFTFRGSQISNDALVTLGAALTLLGLVRLLRGPYDTRIGLATAVALAGAYLSKISAIALVVPAVFALIASPGGSVVARTRRVWVLAVTVALVLPWSLRNVWLYGDPFASGAMHTAVAHLITERPLLSPYFVTVFPALLSASFVGSFGWANLLLPVKAYAIYGALLLVALAGLVRGWRARTLDRRLVLLLALTGICALAVVVHINRSFTQPQGRYLFPALPAIATLVALGLGSLPWRALTSPVLFGLLFGGLNLFALIAVVGGSYYPAPDRWLDGRSRLLQPVALGDLRADSPTRWRVSGPHPWWITPLDVPAERLHSLVLEMRGTGSNATRELCVRVATRERPLLANPPQCVAWTDAAAPQRVEIPLARSGWIGEVTHLRVDPLGDHADPGWTLEHHRALLIARAP